MQKSKNIEDMHPGPNIKRRRKELELTLEQFAVALEKRLGKPVNTGNLSRLERGKQGYSNELLQAIAVALNMRTADLFREGDGINSRDEPELVRLQPVLSSNKERNNDVSVAEGQAPSYAIPVMNLEGAMGSGRAQPDFETIVGEIAVSPIWVRAHLSQASSPSNIRIITGYGDSMAGTYEDGDVLFVDIGYKEVRLDAVYVFELNREIFVKRLQRNKNGSLTAHSDNKRYDPLQIDDREEVHIIGRVVGAWNWKRF